MNIGQQLNNGIEIDSKAPEFSCVNDQGENVTLSSLAGQNFVLYFYPKDDTPGCTQEAKDFTAKLDEFTKTNTLIIGVSKDSVAKHQKFKAKYEIPYTLLADESTKLITDYGVWKQKSLYGKTYMGIERTTFLIDAQGTIRHIWKKVKVKEHVNNVLEAAQSI